MNYSIDERIVSTCFALGDWPLSRVFLKNNAYYPWLILVPRQKDIHEINQLPRSTQHILMDEISALSSIAETYFKPNKLNVGTLGNIVSQLHIHVIARFTHDTLWPHSVWQAGLENRPYEDEVLRKLLVELRQRVSIMK